MAVALVGSLAAAWSAGFTGSSPLAARWAGASATGRSIARPASGLADFGSPGPVAVAACVSPMAAGDVEMAGDAGCTTGAGDVGVSGRAGAEEGAEDALPLVAPTRAAS